MADKERRCAVDEPARRAAARTLWETGLGDAGGDTLLGRAVSL
jgi:hypothetical protein